MSGHFPNITLIGCGLIGSSLARAIRKYTLADSLVIAEREDVVDRVKAIGCTDRVTSDLKSAVKDADLVMLCVPISAYEPILKQIQDDLKPGAILSDVGSVKVAALELMQKYAADHIHFVPGHPIAGTENSGPEAGFAELFADRWHILTPTDDHAHDYRQAVTRLEKFWQSCGAKTAIMPAAHHDRVLAMTSHLPHLIAYSIVDTCVKLENSMQQEVIAYSAGGFRDFTRIAASDPTMWRDIFLTNKEAVLDGLQRFIEDLMELQKAIRWDDGDKLFDVFTRTREVRRSIIDQRQHIPEDQKKS